MKFKTVAIVVAMEEEIQELLKSLEAKLEATEPFHTIFSAQCEGLNLVFSINPKTRIESKIHGPVLIAHIGTVPAALNTQSMIQKYKPDLVINAGTCGGFKSRGGQIGDVIVSQKIFYHDRRVSIPGFQEFFDRPIECLDASLWAQKLDLKLGTVSTGDSFDMSREDLARLNLQKADAKEMEAAAVGFVCAQSRVPFLALKSITDLVDEIHDQTAQDQFLENLESASRNLCQNLRRVFGEIASL